MDARRRAMRAATDADEHDRRTCGAGMKTAAIDAVGAWLALLAARAQHADTIYVLACVFSLCPSWAAFRDIRYD